MVCGNLFLKIVQNTCHQLEIQTSIRNFQKLGQRKCKEYGHFLILLVQKWLKLG